MRELRFYKRLRSLLRAGSTLDGLIRSSGWRYFSLFETGLSSQQGANLSMLSLRAQRLVHSGPSVSFLGSARPRYLRISGDTDAASNDLLGALMCECGRNGMIAWEWVKVCCHLAAERAA